ncbi:MAG: Flp/Fap pilin component, partial [Pseudomonadota bacterium]
HLGIYLEWLMKKINKLFSQIRRFGREDQGLTMVEYAVAGALIAVAATVAFQSLGSAVASKITSITSTIGG